MGVRVGEGNGEGAHVIRGYACWAETLAEAWRGGHTNAYAGASGLTEIGTQSLGIVAHLGSVANGLPRSAGEYLHSKAHRGSLAGQDQPSLAGAGPSP